MDIDITIICIQRINIFKIIVSSMFQIMFSDVEDAMFLFAYDDSKRVSTKEVGAVIRSVGLNPTEAELKDIQNIVQSQCKI